MTVVRQNILSTVIVKNDNFAMKISDCIWQHQKYTRPLIEQTLYKTQIQIMPTQLIKVDNTLISIKVLLLFIN